MHSMQILLLIFPITLCKLFTHGFLEFEYRQGGVEMVRWSRRQWKCWWSPSMEAHRRFCHGHRLTAVCTDLTLGGGILWSLCGSRSLHRFLPCVFILPIAMVIINLTVMQWQITTILKPVLEAPIVVPANAIFFVMHCAWGIQRGHSNGSYGGKVGFDGGGHRTSLEVRHQGTSSRALSRAVCHGDSVGRTFHGGFLVIKHSLCTGCRFLYKRRKS